MATLTTRIPEELDKTLSLLSKEIDRPKGYLVKKAIECYLEEKAEMLIALARIANAENTISLKELEKKYGLED